MQTRRQGSFKTNVGSALKVKVSELVGDSREAMSILEFRFIPLDPLSTTEPLWGTYWLTMTRKHSWSRYPGSCDPRQCINNPELFRTPVIGVSLGILSIKFSLVSSSRMIVSSSCCRSFILFPPRSILTWAALYVAEPTHHAPDKCINCQRLKWFSSSNFMRVVNPT